MKVIEYIIKQHQLHNAIYRSEIIAASLLATFIVSLIMILIFVTEDGSSFFYKNVLRLYEYKIWGIARFVWLLSLVLGLKYLFKFTIWFLQSLILLVQKVKRKSNGSLTHVSEAVAFIILMVLVVLITVGFTYYLLQEQQGSNLMRFSEYEIVDLAGEFLTTLLMVALIIYAIKCSYFVLLYLVLLVNSIVVSKIVFEPLELPHGRVKLNSKFER